jgi:hypothetical protein
MSNWLFAEPLIIARLKTYPALIPLVNLVDGMTDFDSVLQRAQGAPALFVSYAGEKIEETYRESKTQLVQQRWGVIVAVGTAANILAGGTVRDKAGAIMAEVGNALFDYRVAEGVPGLIPLDPPPPVYKTGKAFFILMFGLQLVRDYN